MSLGPDESDLAWTATRYALGELPAAEELAFETLMADDQAAREALADAVDLLGATAIVLAERPLAIPARRRNRATWVAMAAAACVLAIAALFGLTWRSSATRSTEVARAWSDLRTGVDAEWTTLVEAHPPITSVEPEASPVDVESSTDRPLPSWLLTAASTPADGPAVEEN